RDSNPSPAPLLELFLSLAASLFRGGQGVLGAAEDDLIEGGRAAGAGQAQCVDADGLAEDVPQVDTHHLPLARHLVSQLSRLRQLAVRTVAGVERDRVVGA